MIISKTPLRLSLVGGGTDMPNFYKQSEGGVVSFTINKYVYVICNKKFDNTVRVSYSKTENVDSVFELEHELIREAMKFHSRERGQEIVTVADIPGGGTGLGSSSALLVGLCNIFSNYHRPGELAERAWMLESEKCGKSVGKQDHYASAVGGMNYFTFRTNSVGINNMAPSKDLESHLLLLWTGKSRKAENILREQHGNFHDPDFVEIGKKMAEYARNFYVQYQRGMTAMEVGEWLNLGWEQKKKLAADITDPEIDDWYKIAVKNGAYGGKLCGAGGGGFLLFIAPHECHKEIVRLTGLKKEKIKIETNGSEIIYEA